MRKALRANGTIPNTDFTASFGQWHGSGYYLGRRIETEQCIWPAVIIWTLPWLGRGFKNSGKGVTLFKNWGTTMLRVLKSFNFFEKANKIINQFIELKIGINAIRKYKIGIYPPPLVWNGRINEIFTGMQKFGIRTRLLLRRGLGKVGYSWKLP